MSRRAGLNQGCSFINDGYKYFKSRTSNNLSRTIDLKTFKLIIKDMYKLMAICILDGKEIALPCSMGTIFVNKKQSDLRKIADFKSTNEQGKFVREHNDHTDGYRFSVKWRKSKPLVGVQNGYQFKSSRLLARELASRLKNGYGYKYQSISKNKICKDEI